MKDGCLGLDDFRPSDLVIFARPKAVTYDYEVWKYMYSV